ncbi:DUF1266 domain-containing protein [Actinophytocola oryzae]|uniref:Uncharacterized protein DUF1266 n=1 Tax=Actinophytocola oryzae TaxID=502181 RepID=A0A4R7UTV3_9PSEU|nr:DUF1266 domain-containing protein [Actinophytocola oryzae]TDV40093.1 uncharacterized protein DUF1266 [Actinophytocola oryzae]
MIDQLRQQMGGMFWVVTIGAPVMLLVLVLQIVLSARTKVNKVRQVLRSGAVTTDPAAPTTGPLAFGLACGAHMAVNQGVAWNDIEGTAFPRMELKANLAEMWGVYDHTDWRRVTEAKLTPTTDNPEHVAIELRCQSGAADFRRAIDQAAHSVPALMAAAERVTRYEDRFRVDGLITGVVSSVRVYDWGRAVNLARWGLRAGYCDRAEAENVVLRVAELCRAHYASWADLSAGFALGRLLFFDDEDFPIHYVTVRETHRNLLEDVDSPYRTMPWPAGIRA